VDRINRTLELALKGQQQGLLHQPREKEDIPILMRLPLFARAGIERFKELKLLSVDGRLVPISTLINVRKTAVDQSIYHKNLMPVVYVTGDVAGVKESPVYAILEMKKKIDAIMLPEGYKIIQHTANLPQSDRKFEMKWDGEWQITYETFRDMGIAYAVGLVLIFLLVVAQFRSYLLPLVIMAPIPLTVIGVMPGHALLGAQFTATSMIGMIALAGIIVRNSILLVDFIQQEQAAGTSLEDAVIAATTVRAKPILLTALAAMMGAFFILDDPIFNGLAIALIFGILVSTLLTLLVIPVLFYSSQHEKTSPGT